MKEKPLQQIKMPAGKMMYHLTARFDDEGYEFLEKFVQKHSPTIRNKSEAIRYIIYLCLHNKII